MAAPTSIRIQYPDYYGEKQLPKPSKKKPKKKPKKSK
jgi:hypothetical protein